MTSNSWNNLMRKTGFAEPKGSTESEWRSDYETLKANRKEMESLGISINECSATTYFQGREFSSLVITANDLSETEAVRTFENFANVSCNVMNTREFNGVTFVKVEVY